MSRMAMGWIHMSVSTFCNLTFAKDNVKNPKCIYILKLMVEFHESFHSYVSIHNTTLNIRGSKMFRNSKILEIA